MIDAELYRTFLIVGRCGNISLASKQLFISQPAVSKSIRKLEELSGCVLFSRTSKGVTLTSEGQLLFDYVEKGFEHLENGEKILAKLRNKEAGHVKIGISATLCRHILIPHLERFSKEYPNIRVTVINRSSDQTLEKLCQGAIDFAIISRPEMLMDCIAEDLMDIHDIMVSGARYKDLVPSSLLLSQIENYPLMMLEKGNATRSFVEAFLLKNGVTIRAENEISNLDFLVEFARIGLGIAPVIEEFVQDELDAGLLRKIDLIPAIPKRKVALVYQAKFPLSTAAKTCMDSLKQEYTK